MAFEIENGVLKKYTEEKGVTEVVIPDSVTSIGESAFEDCNSLQSVTIPDSVKSIGDWAFRYCRRLKSVMIPDSVKSIGDRAFDCCSSLQSVTIPDSVTSIGNRAFDECTSLQSITIPDGVTSIDYGAFRNCCSLQSVTIPDSVKSIGKYAFKDCISLQSVTIPDSVTSIGYEAFSECTSLETIISTKKDILKLNVFGNKMPKSLIKNIELCHMSFDTETYIDFVLTNLEKLSHNQISKISKELYSRKTKFNDIRKVLHERLTDKPRVKDCIAAAYFSNQFHKKLDKDYLLQIYEHLKYTKNGNKALNVMELNSEIMAKISGDSINIGKNEADRFVLEKESSSGLGNYLSALYSITLNQLPELKDINGNILSPYVLAWLLTVDNGYNKPGFSQEPAKLIELIDKESLQKALLKIVDDHLGVGGSTSKKHNLAVPICRYADKDTMKELCKRAPRWASKMSGMNSPAAHAFRFGVLFSDTFSAMLFADKYDDLIEYARIRNTDADTIRDKYLSDVGLDKDGGKIYDLGNQTVIARLQPDMTFLFELTNGKTAKSLPKKGADNDKYEAAKKDFADMKKNSKRILTNRFNRLFEDFLSGRSVNAERWQDSYLNNPLLFRAAKLIVWAQGKHTFILSDSGAIDSNEKPYTVSDKAITVAHPMEMEQSDVNAWQNYFTSHGLKQPFAQIWEPVRNPEFIKSDRYKGFKLSIGSMQHMDKHGIHEYGIHNYSENYGISLDGCELDFKGSTWRYRTDIIVIGEENTYTLGNFSYEKYTRKVNHIVTIFDRIFIEAPIKSDDAEAVVQMLPGFTLAQILDFIKLAQENNAVNVTAALLEYRNNNFSYTNPLDELVLDW